MKTTRLAESCRLGSPSWGRETTEEDEERSCILEQLKDLKPRRPRNNEAVHSDLKFIAVLLPQLGLQAWATMPSQTWNFQRCYLLAAKPYRRKEEHPLRPVRGGSQWLRQMKRAWSRMLTLEGGKKWIKTCLQVELAAPGNSLEVEMRNVSSWEIRGWYHVDSENTRVLFNFVLAIFILTTGQENH